MKPLDQMVVGSLFAWQNPCDWTENWVAMKTELHSHSHKSKIRQCIVVQGKHAGTIFYLERTTLVQQFTIVQEAVLEPTKDTNEI